MSFLVNNGLFVMYHEQGGETEFVIPTGVSKIGAEAFRNCNNLESVTVPKGVTEVGDRAFYYCSNLTSIKIPYTVEKIGAEAFCGCKKLKSVDISDNTNEIGDRAFYYCSGLTSVKIPQNVGTIGFETFYYCTSLKTVTIAQNVTKIDSEAFYRCESLEEIVIPDSVTEIGDRAFYYCTNLKTVTIGENVKKMGSWVFRNCTNLETIIYKGIKLSWEKISLTKIQVEDVFKIIDREDFSSKIPASMKYDILRQLFMRGGTSDKFNNYFRKNFIKIFKMIIDMKDIEFAEKISNDTKYLTAKNIDSLISYAHEKRGFEISVILMDYKDTILKI